MTPAELREYLEVVKASGLHVTELKIPGKLELTAAIVVQQPGADAAEQAARLTNGQMPPFVDALAEIFGGKLPTPPSPGSQ